MIRCVIAYPIALASLDFAAMTLLAGGRNLAWRGRGGLLLNALLFAGFAALATASMVYLLAPRWAEAPVSLDAPWLPIVVAGVVVLIALASQNAILIVEFAMDQHVLGASIEAAAVAARACGFDRF